MMLIVYIKHEHIRTHLLSPLVVTRACHVGNVCRDGFDLLHELITDPAIILTTHTLVTGLLT